eukprot:CAMPEP_0170751212 /NCGR_PEP_ID=MMETSP0437-20130122/11335_1 /TAXON_ID=0 /ORGANISM="Sexangularia sp." /LENGTH=172 /DNA_ID=CAMNT_0011090241 /DNA_START=113 /DNA_END=631 /DNA_ORIENTATION=+
MSLVAPTAAASQSAMSMAVAPRRCFQVKTFADVEKNGDVKVAETGTWESRRYFLRKDGIGFSMHHTILYAGKTTLIHYKNHFEAVFITQGSGTIELVGPGQKQGEGTVHKLEPGTAYALDDPAADRHYLSASTEGDMHVVCAFYPPLTGNEDHDEDGVYLPAEPKVPMPSEW